MLSWWLSSKESICNAGNLQETRVLSLGQEDPQEKEPTLVFSPGKSHGQRSLAGCHSWGPEVSDMTEPRTIKLYFKKLGYLEPADFSCAHGCPVSQTFPASSTGRLIVRLTVPPGWNGKQFTWRLRIFPRRERQVLFSAFSSILLLRRGALWLEAHPDWCASWVRATLGGWYSIQGEKFPGAALPDQPWTVCLQTQPWDRCKHLFAILMWGLFVTAET